MAFRNPTAPLRALALAALLLLSACATCERHPAACGVAGAAIVGAVTYAVAHTHERHAMPCTFETGALLPPGSGEAPCH